MTQITIDINNVEFSIRKLAPLMNSFSMKVEDYVPNIPHTPLPKSGYRGVEYTRSTNTYRGRTMLKSIPIVVKGKFINAKECANARDTAMRFFGIPCRLTDGSICIPTRKHLKMYKNVHRDDLFSTFKYINQSLLVDIETFIYNNGFSDRCDGQLNNKDIK